MKILKYSASILFYCKSRQIALAPSSFGAPVTQHLLCIRRFELIKLICLGQCNIKSQYQLEFYHYVIKVHYVITVMLLTLLHFLVNYYILQWLYKMRVTLFYNFFLNENCNNMVHFVHTVCCCSCLYFFYLILFLCTYSPISPLLSLSLLSPF